MWKWSVSGNTCSDDVSSKLRSQVRARCQRGAFQGKAPHCSPFPIVTSSFWGQISCHSLYNCIRWGKREKRGKPDSKRPPKSSCGEEEIIKVSLNYYQQFQIYWRKHSKKSFRLHRLSQDMPSQHCGSSPQGAWAWTGVPVKIKIQLGFWFGDPAWFLLAEFPGVPSNHLLWNLLWIGLKV